MVRHDRSGGADTGQFDGGRQQPIPLVGTGPGGVVMGGTRVLLADDHPLYREGVRALLETEPGLEVVGAAATGPEVVRMAAELLPDVVVMDLRMPGLDGIEATRQVLAANPQIRVLVLTMFDDDNQVLDAMRAGAHGYLLKDGDPEQLVIAVRAVSCGETVLGGTVAKRMIEFSTRPARPSPPRAFPQLTAREHEVLELMARGERNDLIARRLFLSEKTVRNNVSNIFTKLCVTSRAQAVARARDAGYGRASTPR